LGQVDAAIGGKVAINAAWGKNLVGAFHLPKAVVVDPHFLSTLPVREWRAGVGEVIKSALIRGGRLFEVLGQLDIGPDSAELWGPVIEETARIKIDLVNQDLYEHGPRMYLNLGHTVGHALENLLGYGTLSHGEAVGLGTLAALKLSERVLGLSSDVRTVVADWMQRWGLPTVMPPLVFEDLRVRLQRDKKARSTGLTWVLVESVGRPRLMENIDWALIEEVVSSLQA
jgi:3-dehydroquinate synthase